MLAEPGLPLTERSEPLFIGLGVGQKSTLSRLPRSQAKCPLSNHKAGARGRAGGLGQGIPELL